MNTGLLHGSPVVYHMRIIHLNLDIFRLACYGFNKSWLKRVLIKSFGGPVLHVLSEHKRLIDLQLLKIFRLPPLCSKAIDLFLYCSKLSNNPQIVFGFQAMILEYCSPDTSILILFKWPAALLERAKRFMDAPPCLMAARPLSIDPAKYSLIGMENGTSLFPYPSRVVSSSFAIATSLTDLSSLSKSCIALAMVQISASSVKGSIPSPPNLVGEEKARKGEERPRRQLLYTSNFCQGAKPESATLIKF
ncbi:hypothetical protein OUZ56_012243 [Daphnia magna]|uniref:Uncharacterized protein n=1 Tax=Daphnia magna TaxID=35525 RepID=A0ABQ9Z2F2_9CRUS|nr:hypothetical protein OUZ56_012243 [Daphnia magna]